MEPWSMVYGHATLNKPDVGSWKLSRVELVSSWIGDHLGRAGAVGWREGRREAGAGGYS